MQNYNLKYKINFCLLSVIFSFVLFVLPLSEANAAQLYFERSDDMIHEGDTFEVALLLDTEGKDLNAVEGNISFSDNLVLRSINDGASLVTLWVERPVLEGKNIIFAGIVPGGYRGELSPYWSGYKPGEILALVFKSTLPGITWFKIGNVVTLLNDGEGTSVMPNIENMQFTTLEAQEGKDALQGPYKYDDIDLPELFTPQIVQDKNVFDEKFFLVFETQDKGSGILFYEIKEGKEKFIKAESPYLLEDQTLKSFIQIKAVDRSGNARIIDIEPTYPPAVYKNYSFWIIIILIIIIIWRIRRKHSRLH